jgi:hypothetical protein
LRPSFLSNSEAEKISNLCLEQLDVLAKDFKGQAAISPKLQQSKISSDISVLKGELKTNVENIGLLKKNVEKLKLNTEHSEFKEAQRLESTANTKSNPVRGSSGPTV